jgi:diguanylate cyclase (GGDEF)-like protein
MTILNKRLVCGENPENQALENIGILLVTKDRYLSKRLANIFKNAEQAATVCHSQADLHNYLNYFVPEIVIMDADMLDDKCKVLLHSVQERAQRKIPCIFFDDEYSTKQHLECVMASGVAYLTKPIEVDLLIEIVVRYTAKDNDEPHRILIVDDDLAMSNYYAAILANENMQVTCCDKPLEIIKYLNDVRPDLLLLDLYMPECSGIELASMIRQLESYASMPIVFLSGETDIQKKLLGMSLGADEFLNKGIKPWHLVASVKSRVERSKKLKMIMDSDPLTGLLNKRAFNDQLERELKTSVRKNSTLSVAMLDIDNFKTINDTYGHMAGDKVIKLLASILKYRLRASDIVARYGGEEFIVIFKDANINDSSNVVKNILDAFCSYKHSYKDKEFHVTFSCGIADVKSTTDKEKLINCADYALYEAKDAGKNRIVKFECN